MPEITPPKHPTWAPTPSPERSDNPRRAVITALGVTAVLTAGWGLLSGLTERHFTAVLPVVGALLAVALTSTSARRPWFPAFAALLGFAVGYLGDIAAVALLLWRNGYSLATILGHCPGLIRAVNDGHSLADWAYFLGTAAIAFLATAARQKNRPTTAQYPTAR